MTQEGYKINIKTETLCDVERCLRAKSDMDERNRIGLNAMRTTAIRVFATVYGSEWGRINVADVDMDRLLAKFKSITQKEYSEKTLNVYRARVRRVFKIYEREIAEKKSIQVTNLNFEQYIRRFMQQIDQMKKTFAMITANYMLTNEARNKYNVHAIARSSGNPVVLAVPKEICDNDAKILREALERAYNEVKTKKEDRCE